MSHFWTLSINQESNVACAVHPYIEKLRMAPTTAGGWGLGCYHVGEVLQRIEPREQGEVLDVESIVDGLEADLVIMHHRRATVGQVRRENTHPFRFKEWLFAHNGTLDGFDDYRDKMRDSMPPFVLRNIRGDTDSEHLFHLFLSFLYDEGLLDRPDLGVDLIRGGLRRAFVMADELAKGAGHQPSAGSAVVSDGYSVVILSRGIPVDYTSIEGISNCTVCRSSIQPGEAGQESGIHHDNLLAVLVQSSACLEQPAEGFIRLDDDSFLMVNKKHQIEFATFS